MLQLNYQKSFDQTFFTDSETEDEQTIEKTDRITTHERQPLKEEKQLTVENLQRLSKEHIQELKQNEKTWSTEVLAPSIARRSHLVQSMEKVFIKIHLP